MSRREFLATASGVAGLLALSGCGDGFLANPHPQIALPAGPVVITVGSFPALSTADVLVRVPNTFVAVKRLDASSFRALSMICTHQGCATNITNGQRLDCPCHLSRFTSDGAVINGPNTGESIGPLPLLTTTYDPATDELTIS